MISGKGASELVTGKQNAFYSTLEELRNHFDRIDVLCPQSKDKVLGTRDKGEYKLFDNVFIHTSHVYLIAQPWFIRQKGTELYKKHKYNIVTVQEYPPFYNGIGAWLLRRAIGNIPFIYEIMHISGHPCAFGIKEEIYKLLMKYLIALDVCSAKAVRVINQRQTKQFLINSGVSIDKIQYIPAFYIDLETYKPINLEKKYDLIFVGRLSKNKGINLLMESMKYLTPPHSLLLAPRISPITLLIVGQGPEQEYIKKFIKKNNLEQNITLYGWAKDNKEVAKLINQSLILIMPSYNEGGPRVTLEAMACGVPVLTTRVGIMNDIIIDGQNGIFIDWNTNDISNKILGMFNAKHLTSDQTSEKLKEIGQKGKTTVQQFERQQAISNYANFLKDMI